jgi:hypothetical protein
MQMTQSLLVVMALCGAAGTAALPAGLFVPVDGQPAKARFVEADAQGQWTFAVGTTQRKWLAGEVVRWGIVPEPARGPVVVFTNGGLMPGEPLRIDAGRLTLRSEEFGDVLISLESLAGIALLWPAQPAQQDRLADRLIETKGTADRVLLANGDQMDATVSDLGSRAVRLDGDTGPIDLPRDRVRAIAFNPALRAAMAKTAASTWVGWADGTLLVVDRLLAADSTVRFVPAGANANSPPWTAKIERLVFLQPIGGRAVYLSDRAADEYQHVPFLDLAWPYHNDRNVLGERPRAGGRTYLKGLGVHSAARLTYALDQPFEGFEASLAIDDAAGGGGSVQCEVLVDGHRRWTSGPIRGHQRPVPVRVDLTGAKRLELVVDFGERGDQLDYVDWLDARLIRPATPVVEKQSIPQEKSPRKEKNTNPR